MQSHPTPQTEIPPCKPFLKWAGGKQRLLKSIRPLLAPGKRLIEPFLGAGSVFLGTDYDRYLLGDANPDLIAVWVALQVRPQEFIRRAEQFFTPENWAPDAYYRIRKEFNEEEDRFERAVRFIYLNRFGFNGVYRVNSAGVMNTPYGHPKAMPLYPQAALEGAARKLDRAKLHSGGFRFALEEAGDGDVVYCDPPYSDVGVESFTGYTQGGFGIDEHRVLCALASEAAERGAVVAVSNHDNDHTRQLYSGWKVYELEVSRTVGRDGRGRSKADELLAVLTRS